MERLTKQTANYDEAIAYLQPIADSATVGHYSEMLNIALSALREKQEREKNEPLTLDELRQMDGEPVYVVTLDNPLENQPYWAIAGINSNDSRYQNGVALYNRVQRDWGAFDLYGDTWLAYRRKPERSDSDA